MSSQCQPLGAGGRVSSMGQWHSSGDRESQPSKPAAQEVPPQALASCLRPSPWLSPPTTHHMSPAPANLLQRIHGPVLPISGARLWDLAALGN